MAEVGGREAGVLGAGREEETREGANCSSDLVRLQFVAGLGGHLQGLPRGRGLGGREGTDGGEGRRRAEENRGGGS